VSFAELIESMVDADVKRHETAIRNRGEATAAGLA
jgi:hypothetical protein